jgi:outer membrane protein assembly factor BamB
VVDDPDAIWKPGYDGPPPVAAAPREPAAPSEPARPPRRERDEATSVDALTEFEPPTTGRAAPSARSRGRRSTLGVGLAVLVIGAVVVVDPLGWRNEATSEVASDTVDAAAVDVPEGDRPVDDGASTNDPRPAIGPPDASVFGGTAAGRLPVGAETLWSVDIAHDGDHWVDVVRRDLVLAAVADPAETTDGGATATTLVALDALTGQERWTLPLVGAPGDAAVVGAVDDVLVLEQLGPDGPWLTGVDIASGERRWSAAPSPSNGSVGLVGTPFVARLPSAPDPLVALIDARSGDQIGAIESDPTASGRPGGWSTDGAGTWYVARDGEVVEYDLRSTLGGATAVGRVDDVSAPLLVVDDRLVVVDDAGSITFDAVDSDPPVTVAADVPAMIRSLTPVSASTFVVSAPGSITGVGVDGDTARVTWSRRDGVVMEHHPVVGGSLVQLATRGGASMQLVDGQSGATVEHFTMVPGVLQALVVAGDGAVVLGTSDGGPRLVGIDLDGAERWSIPGSTPVIVGDRVVVRATANAPVDDDGASSLRPLRITAYGDAD